MWNWSRAHEPSVELASELFQFLLPKNYFKQTLTALAHARRVSFCELLGACIFLFVEGRTERLADLIHQVVLRYVKDFER